MQKPLVIKVFFIILLSTPLLFYSVNDYEEYGNGLYSTIFLFKNFNNFFTNFNTQLGMGSHFPIGQGLFLYPTSLLSFNLKIFLFFTVVLNLIIQIYYFERILKRLKIYIEKKFISYLIIFFLVFSISNLSYNYIDDWISIHTSYTLFFPIIFYIIKFQSNYNPSALSKIAIFFIIYLYNGHIGHLLQIIIFLIAFILFNKTNIFINRKYLIFISLFFLLVCSPRIFDYLTIFKSYPTDISKSAGNTSTYKISDFIEAFLLPVNYVLRIFDFIFNSELSNKDIIFNGREIGYGSQLLFSFLISIWLIVKKFSKRIYFINLIYILFILVFIFLTNLPKFQTYFNLSRDVLFILSLIILSIFLVNTTYRKIKFFLILILLSSNIFLFTESLRHLVTHDVLSLNSNFTKNKEFENELKNLSNQNDKIFFRVYLSEGVFDEINDKRNIFFKKNKVLTPKDLTQYNLNIFNVHLKNTPFMPIRKPPLVMHNILNPYFTEIEDIFIMNFYRIKYLIIFEKELQNIDNLNYKKIYELKFKNQKLIILENLKFKNHLIIEESYESFECFDHIKLNCLKQIRQKFKNNYNITISKISNNKFQIQNNNQYDINLLSPFINNQILNNLDKTNNLFGSFQIIKVKSNTQIIINYLNYTYVFIKVFAIVIFIVFIYLINNRSFLRKRFNI